MYHIYKRLIQKFITVGSLQIEMKSGRSIIAAGLAGGYAVTIGLSDERALRRMICNPELSIGELYMDGDLWIITGTLEDFMILLHDNVKAWDTHPIGRLSRHFHKIRAALKTVNKPAKAKRNVAHHYDLDDRLYNKFLDRWRQYSCAYFDRPDMSLDEAQKLKLARIGAKLNLKPGLSVLDIGCGWGGLAYALRLFEPDTNITGITLSDAQYTYANQTPDFPLAADKKRPEFALADYRSLSAQFDRIVSVGMFEHVGPQNFTTYFQMLAKSLKPDGTALIHTIARFHTPKPTNPWIEKYIFSGGYLPDIGQINKAVQKAGLFITDIEIMRLHYAETLKAWRERFLEHRDELIQIYDDTFARMWEFYLLGSEYYFRSGAGMVLQIQLAHRQDAVPLTRDYIFKTSKLYVKRLCQHEHSGKQNHYQK